MADKKKMSVEDILAACRGADGEGTGPAAGAPTESAEAPSKPAAKPTPKAAAPAAGKSGDMSVADILAAARGGSGGGKPAEATDTAPAAASPAAAAGKKPGEMSVAEMLAAARAGKSGGAEKPKPKPAAAKAKPAAKAGAKSAKKVPAAAAEPRDTSSILAAARKAVKPGPMSKAEAAAKGKEIPKGGKSAPPMPVKPAYAKPAAKKKDEEDRRGFFGQMIDATVGSFMAVGFSSLGIVGGLWTLGFAKFMFPNILTEPPSRFKVGFPADFAPDTVTTKYKAQFGVWVVNTEYEGQQMITALKSVCTHLGCTPNWLEGEQKFKCPCHGSGFYKEGINFEGPAPRPLERYSIKIADDGQLEIDKSKTYQQEMGAWADGTSYVPV